MKIIIAVFCSVAMTHSVVAQESAPVVVEKDVNPKNVISYDFLSPLYGKAALSYERILAKGYLGLRLPVSIGFGGAELGLNPKWEVGFETRIYPTAQGKFKYYFGLEGKFGRMNSWYNNCPTCYYPHYESYVLPVPRDFLAVYAKNGVMYNPFKHLGFNAALGLGFYREISPYSFRNFTEHGYFEVGVNYRF